MGTICLLLVTNAAACGGLDSDVAEIGAAPRLPALCKLPADVGRCDGHYTRWYFNSAKGMCEKFIYGGCGGNKNNFDTIEECQKTCWCPPQCYCYCKFGFRHDEYGCVLCSCIDPCKGVFCPAGQICEADKVLCVNPPCPPVTRCVGRFRPFPRYPNRSNDNHFSDPNCCDGRPYDHVKQICCQRRLYTRKDDVACCAVDSLYSVNPPYNVISEICCQGVVQKRPCNAACCGRRAYDELKTICCDGELQDRPPNAKCCGKRAYDSRRFVCCGGYVQKRPNNAFG